MRHNQVQIDEEEKRRCSICNYHYNRDDMYLSLDGFWFCEECNVTKEEEIWE